MFLISYEAMHLPPVWEFLLTPSLRQTDTPKVNGSGVECILVFLLLKKVCVLSARRDVRQL